MDRSGNFAISLALLSFPLLAVIGLAVDYSNLARVKTVGQNALDAAVLAAARTNDEATAIKTAQYVYANNGGAGDVGKLNIVYSKSEFSLSVSGSVEFNENVFFAGIFGFDTRKIVLKSTAISSPQLDEVLISSVGAQGAWNKDMTLMARDVSKSTYDEVAWAKYRYWSEYGKGYSSISTSANLSNYISLKNKSSVYFKMKVYSWSGTFEVSMLDPNQGKMIWISDTNGSNLVRLDYGKPIELSTLVPCGKVKKLLWEDGGSDSSVTDAQDFWFNITGKCNYSESSPVRLSR